MQVGANKSSRKQENEFGAKLISVYLAMALAALAPTILDTKLH
jgi:hypothetical protein